MMNLVSINALIKWECRKAQGGNWIAECHPLGLTIQSARYSELAEDIGDALDLLFRDLLGNHELDDFLKSHGWTRARKPLPAKLSDTVFDVPFELLLAGKDGTAASVH